MSERPKWAEAIRYFLTDTVFDDEYGYPMDGSDDWLHDQIERAVDHILCREYGHHIIPDQCGIPDHRYCVYCRRLATDLEEKP